jgi:hypothetical protein
MKVEAFLSIKVNYINQAHQLLNHERVGIVCPWTGEEGRIFQHLFHHNKAQKESIDGSAHTLHFRIAYLYHRWWCTWTDRRTTFSKLGFNDLSDINLTILISLQLQYWPTATLKPTTTWNICSLLFVTCSGSSRNMWTYTI